MSYIFFAFFSLALVIIITSFKAHTPLMPRLRKAFSHLGVITTDAFLSVFGAADVTIEFYSPYLKTLLGFLWYLLLWPVFIFGPIFNVTILYDSLRK